MISFTDFPTYNENCKFRFETRPNGNYVVYDKETGEEIKELEPSIQPEVESAVELWRGRYESLVGTPANIVDGIANNNPTYLKDFYEMLLAGAIMLLMEQKGINPDKVIPQIERTLEWLEGTDFFDTAASTVFHDSEPCGLAYHSLKVYNQIIVLRELPQFKNCSLAEAAIVALVHDWDKIYKYEPYQRNVKNEETGQWEKVLSYRISPKNVPLGNGVASMFVVSKFVQLSAEAMLAIRWHMGAWNITGEDQKDLNRANAVYPLVHLIQFADQLSITEYAKAIYN